MMSLTVLEVLENAQYNLERGVTPIQKDIGLKQLGNAIKQLEEDGNADAEYEVSDERN